MRGKEVATSLFCAATGAAMVYLLRVFLGYWPNPAIVVGVILASIGATMVVGRFSRLGPFNGELGSPWFENELRESIVREADRAVRYGRDFTVAAVRRDVPRANWDPIVRSVDRAIECRHGWMVLVLPETNRPGAMALLRRLNAGDELSQAALVNVPSDVGVAREVPATLLDLLRRPAEPGTVFTPGVTQVEAHPLAF
jgi:hypothetical protein